VEALSKRTFNQDFGTHTEEVDLKGSGMLVELEYKVNFPLFAMLKCKNWLIKKTTSSKSSKKYFNKNVAVEKSPE